MSNQSPRFVHPLSHELYSYWNARRGARPAPYRNEIEPGDIRDVLPIFLSLMSKGSNTTSGALPARVSVRCIAAR